MIAGGAWRTPLNLVNTNASGTGESNKKNSMQSYVVTLTRENMAQHEAKCESHVVHYRPNDAAAIAENGEAGVFIKSAVVNPTTSIRPKTCGLALAMVAIFCYFPGVSMMVSIATVGITNKTVTGIAFTSVAVTLTVSSAVLCLRGKSHSHKESPTGKDEVTHAARCKKQATRSTSASNPLLSSRDDCCIENEEILGSSKPGEVLCECEEIAINNKIAQSFSLNRYFSNLNTMNGPFDLDHEKMDVATEHSIYGEPRSFSSASFANKQRNELSSSTDSAIGIDYDVSSTEGVIDV